MLGEVVEEEEGVLEVQTSKQHRKHENITKTSPKLFRW